MVSSFLSIPLVIGAGVVLLAVFGLVQKLRQDREPLVPFVLFRSRNFTLMNWVSGTLSIGMLGIFLPFTIYLQSALGFSAVKAGLTMAPSSLVMIAVAPFLGRLTDKTGGKYILLGGLSLFAIGMGTAVVALAAASCLALRSKPGQDSGTAAAPGQMAGTISSSGSSGQSPGSSSGTAS